MRPDLLLASTKPKFFTQELEQEFKQYAMAIYPQEACAYIVDDALVPVANVSANPNHEFELHISDALTMEKAQGFIHSHPSGQLRPSALDMQTQIQWGKPFGIVTCTSDSCSDSLWWGDHLLSIQLHERPFIHGIFDCYSLIRAEMYQRTGIILEDYPRNFEWWEREPDGSIENLYEENFEAWGYAVVDSSDELQIGDIIFMKIHSEVVSHAAIYQGNGLILHHLRDRLSRVEHLSSWKKFAEKTVRHTETLGITYSD